MKNRNLLPEDFVIKNAGDSPMWQSFISWLNEGFIGIEPSVSFKGDTDGFYGLIDDCPIILPDASEVQLLALEEWFSLINNGEIEMIECYNGETHEKYKCVQLSRQSRHPDAYCLRSDAFYCEFDNEYILNNEERDCLADGRWFISIDGIPDDVASGCDDTFVDINHHATKYGFVDGSDEQMYFHDPYGNSLRIDGNYYIDGETAEEHGWAWDDNRDQWVHQDELENTVYYCNATYHELERVMKFDSDAEFTVGFEIEKEDDDAGLIKYRDVYKESGWCKERDGSLDDDNGFELVSPAFNLFDDGLDQDINNSKYLKDLINADSSTNCGGHINVGSNKYNTEQLFEGLSGFFPLLYSMYNGRIHRDYCKAKKKHSYYSRDKYSSIYIRDNVVELRIFSAVIDVDNLLWRRDLVRIMCENINKSELEVLRMLLDHRSKLYKHLRKIYSEDRMFTKIELFIRYSNEFNNKLLPEPNKIKNNKKEKQESSNNGNTIALAC